MGGESCSAGEGFPAGTNGARGSVTWDGPESSPGPFWVLGGIKWLLLSRAGGAHGGLNSRRLMSSVCSILKAKKTPGSGGCPAPTCERFLSPGPGPRRRRVCPRCQLRPGWGGPFLSPFSIPAECLGSQQRVTLALVPQEKGRGYLFESAGPTASRTDSALRQRGVPRDRRTGLGGASLLLQVWEP